MSYSSLRLGGYQQNLFGICCIKSTHYSLMLKLYLQLLCTSTSLYITPDNKMSQANTFLVNGRVGKTQKLKYYKYNF